MLIPFTGCTQADTVLLSFVPPNQTASPTPGIAQAEQTIPPPSTNPPAANIHSPVPSDEPAPEITPLPTVNLTESNETLAYDHIGYGYSIAFPALWKPFLEVYRDGDSLAVQFIGESDAAKGTKDGLKRGMNLFTIRAVTQEELADYADPVILAEKYDTTFIAYTEPNHEMTLLDPSPHDSAVQATLKAEDRQNYLVMVGQKDAALTTFTLP